jgi:hypothetical protein
MLAGGVAVTKARVEDALNATRAAVEEGIVSGGGVALLRDQAWVTDITYIPTGAPIQRAPLANSLSWMKRQPARSAAPRSSLAPEMPRMLPTIT